MRQTVGGAVYIWYNNAVKVQYRDLSEMSREAQILAECAKAASEAAVRQAFAAGLSITIGRDGKLIRVAPDGTETVIGDL